MLPISLWNEAVSESSNCFSQWSFDPGANRWVFHFFYDEDICKSVSLNDLFIHPSPHV
jgi:hypothetical protein